MMSTTTATSQATTAEKQGIVVAILGPEGGAGAAAGRCARPGGSLRRTLSADMSSKNWLEQNGFRYSSPMKKIASSKDFSLNPILDSSSSSEDEEEEKGGNCSERSVEIKKEFDIWSSIVSQKAEESSSSSKSLPPPYIHPLVKRSASSLSEKSLQICTESLGSETGSDGFSPSSSEASDSESECCPEKQPREAEAAKFGYYSPSGRKPAAAVRTTSFPPPLPSLSSRCGGDGAPTLLMRSRRDNGRLVVEAVSVPTSHKNFAAQRQDGRLVLMFAGAAGAEATRDETDELEEQFGEEETETEIEIEEDDESEEGEEEEEEEVVDEEEEEVMSRVEMVRETRLINFHRLTLMADKRRSNPATAWPKGEEASPAAAAVAASLPPRPRGPVGRLMPAPAAAKVSTAAAASFNHYEYFWRSKITATAAAGGSCDAKLAGKSQTVENDKRQLVVLRGDGYLVSSLKGCCKEPRRTLIWEPRCIATS